MKIYPVFSLVFYLIWAPVFLFSGCGEPSGDLKGWDKLNVSPKGNVEIHGMAVNDKNVLLSFGHDEEAQDCGPMGMGKCKPFKIFRSYDDGQTWSDISNKEIAEEHAFLSGDKLSPRLLARLSGTYGAAVYMGKKVVDLVAYSEFRPKGRYFADGNDFYMYLDLTLYHSADDGNSWETVGIDHNFLIPEDDDCTIDIIDDYLVVHDITSLGKFVFKRYGKYFVQQENNRFAIVYRNNEKELLFCDNDNLACHYSIYKDDVAKRNPTGIDDGTYAFSEFYELKNGKILTNSIVTYKGYRRKYAMASSDSGASFKIPKIKNLMDGINGLRTLFLYQGTPFMTQMKQDYAVDVMQTHHSYNSVAFGFWNTKKGKFNYLGLPDVNRDFIYGFITNQKYLFYYTKSGIFRRK
ncbi:MAG: hypothetical protein NW218_21855 [Saprospiraceae bacterium]|nr:hypothetical protein [Saprospiraceae bacterium]